MTPREKQDRLRAKGLSQYKLHKKWKVSQAMVSKLVNDKAVSLRLEKRLARALGVTLEELRGPGQTKNDGLGSPDLSVQA